MREFFHLLKSQILMTADTDILRVIFLKDKRVDFGANLKNRSGRGK